jgi:hypothetical protein
VAVGDAAEAAGYSLVPDTGEEGKVKWGAREINRSRDYTAILKALIPGNKTAFRNSSGISSGTSEPAGGTDGDIYFKILP